MTMSGRGAHGAPARERRGVLGSPRAPPSLFELRRASPKHGAGGTEPGCGAEPHVMLEV
jgi:hypothetical protein